MNGGYAMVDFTGCDLGNLGTVAGIYGMVNGEQSFSPIVGYGGVESETSVFVSFFPVTLHISNTDEITM